MNRIDNLFATKKNNILSIYFTAGFPKLNNTTTIINALTDAGADLIEVGMPFSDPIADGPTIQKSNDIALHNGMKIKVLFEQLKDIRKETAIPLILMGHLNPVMQFGEEAFLKECVRVGVDGVILPDLPFDVYLTDYKPLFEKYGIHAIFLITPETSDERIKEIDKAANGFIYMVASHGTTGTKDKIELNQEAYFARVKALNLKNPLMVGFGISNHDSFERVCSHVNGAIIGSAFITALKESTDIVKDIHAFVNRIK